MIKGRRTAREGSEAERPRRLTTREAEVLELMSLGQTNAEVAAELGITVHAVKFHVASVFRKLGVKNRTEAAAAYLTGAASTATEA